MHGACSKAEADCDFDQGIGTEPSASSPYMADYKQAKLRIIMLGDHQMDAVKGKLKLPLAR